VTNTDGGKLKPNNRLLIAQMTTRFETDNLFTRTGWDFWETLSYILQIVELAEGRDDEMGRAIVLHTSILIGRLMEELVSHACGTYVRQTFHFFVFVVWKLLISRRILNFIYVEFGFRVILRT